MQYLNLGKTGLKVSRVCLGTMTFGARKWRDWTLEEEEARPIFRRAIELGINFFDTADVYSLGASEEILGRALTDFGGGLRYYLWGHMFVRPEVRFYNVHNNIADFTNGSIVRVGASIGYTIGPE